MCSQFRISAAFAEVETCCALAMPISVLLPPQMPRAEWRRDRGLVPAAKLAFAFTVGRPGHMSEHAESQLMSRKTNSLEREDGRPLERERGVGGSPLPLAPRSGLCSCQ